MPPFNQLNKDLIMAKFEVTKELLEQEIQGLINTSNEHQTLSVKNRGGAEILQQLLNKMIEEEQAEAKKAEPEKKAK